MRTLTDRDANLTGLRRAVPIVGLSLIVTIGTALGLWMVLAAEGPTGGSVQASAAHGHSTDSTTGHANPAVHSHEGVVPMPGLAQAPPTTGSGPGESPTSDAQAMAGMEGMEGMEGMVPADPVATPSPISPVPVDPMVGMSEQEMAAMAPATGADTSATGDADSGRPLGATLAGFTLVNLAVLVGAVIIGRRARHRSGGRQQGSAPTRRGTSAEAAPSTRPSIKPAGSPS